MVEVEIYKYGDICIINNTIYVSIWISMVQSM